MAKGKGSVVKTFVMESTKQDILLELFKHRCIKMETKSFHGTE